MYNKIFFVIAIFIFSSYTSFAQTTTANTDTVKTITVKVKGVTCKNDLVTLADNVKVLKGVTDCKTGKMGPVSKFEITYNPTLVDTKEIYKAIENTEGCTDPKDRPYKVKS